MPHISLFQSVLKGNARGKERLRWSDRGETQMRKENNAAPIHIAERPEACWN
jgi:hypothetical protein